MYPTIHTSFTPGRKKKGLGKKHGNIEATATTQSQRTMRHHRGAKGDQSSGQPARANKHHKPRCWEAIKSRVWRTITKTVSGMQDLTFRPMETWNSSLPESETKNNEESSSTSWLEELRLAHEAIKTTTESSTYTLPQSSTTEPASGPFLRIGISKRYADVALRTSRALTHFVR